MGSNIVLTDDNENVLVRYEYDVFGAVRSEVGISDNVRKFTGKEWDSDVRLYYFAARYYDPYIGRFTQRDPAGQGLNWYAYVDNNPMRFIDPTGMRKLSWRERNVAVAIFGWTIDYNKVRIKGGAKGRLAVDGIPAAIGGLFGGLPGAILGAVLNKSGSRTIGNTVYTTGDIGIRTLMHELTHIWQKPSLWEAASTGFLATIGFRGSVYDSTIIEGKAFSEYGIEQQASIVYNIANLLVKDVGSLEAPEIHALAYDYIPILKEIQGAGGPVAQTFYGMTSGMIENYFLTLQGSAYATVETWAVVSSGSLLDWHRK